MMTRKQEWSPICVIYITQIPIKTSFGIVFFLQKMMTKNDLLAAAEEEIKVHEFQPYSLSFLSKKAVHAIQVLRVDTGIGRR